MEREAIVLLNRQIALLVIIPHKLFSIPNEIAQASILYHKPRLRNLDDEIPIAHFFFSNDNVYFSKRTILPNNINLHFKTRTFVPSNNNLYYNTEIIMLSNINLYIIKTITTNINNNLYFNT